MEESNLIEILIGIREHIASLENGLFDINKRLNERRWKEEAKDQIYAALAKAQGMYKPLIANDEIAGKKFGNLSAILAATREALSSNELCFIQEIELQDGGSGAALLHTKIGHSSGQFIESIARVVHHKIDRLTGNSYENQKRLHACTLLGIAPSPGDPVLFDDGGIEQNDSVMLSELKKPQPNLSGVKEEVIENSQYKELMYELDGFPEIVKNMLDVYGIDTLADLPKSQYYVARDKIRRIKHTLGEHQREQRTERI